MSDKSFSNELRLALDRADLPELVVDLKDYHIFSSKIAADEPFHSDEARRHEKIMDAYDDTDRGLAYLSLAMSRYDEPLFLGSMAAGLLEDLLRDPTPDTLKRIITEARKTPRFRWMLSGVWLHAIAELARQPVDDAVGGWVLEMPLPPRPWA